MLTRLTSALALSNDAAVNLGILGGEAFHDPFFYLVGQLLSKKTVIAQSFIAAILAVWSLRDCLSIREERNGLFVFQFRVKSKRHWALHGGSWYYNHSMLLLVDYEGIGEVLAIPFQFMEAWVAVTGLSIALRNKRALTLIGNICLIEGSTF